jgi:hypothetical protein
MFAMKNRLLDLFSPSLEGEEQRRRLEDALDRERLQATAEEWIAAHPAVALGAALTLGVFVGWLIKRK